MGISIKNFFYCRHSLSRLMDLLIHLLVLSARKFITGSMTHVKSMISDRRIAELERPRHQLQSKGAANFHSHRQEIYHQIRG